MRKSVNRLKKSAVQAFELPEDVMLHMPVMHLTGAQKLHVENHRGLIEYTTERLRIRTTMGEVVVTGKDMLVKEIGKDDILVLGTVQNVELRLREA